ncbi:ATP binding protein, putative [Ricinus communis]|uniref:ATP binding protein, putative n=1 Tax=Ricinus communis TaxID=3988 RepID=B9RMQ4_RICCO|nr:ATP binding protein, putative [Ricinus communis]|eukprot:XP_002515023.1 early endosome antigen 1 isoform X1 [Ricinus communis]
MSESNDSVELSLQNGEEEEAEEEKEEPSSNGHVVDPQIYINQELEQEQEEVNHVDSKEDMFVDAADDIEDNQFQEMDNNGDTDNEVNQDDKDTVSKEYKEEREQISKEVANLLHQLKNLSNNEDSEELVCGSGSLNEMMSECSQYVKVSLEQKLQTENMIRKLQQQIEELNMKIQVEQNVDMVADRVLGVLNMVVNQEELVDYSVIGKLAHVERSTYLLVEQYRWFLYEVDKLRHCLVEGGFSVGQHEEFGYEFAVARNQLLELKKTEAEMLGKVSYLEDVNRKLVEEVEKEKEMAGIVNSEFEKVKMELEQEKNRYANTKEKLGMAVTRGKALVQQRDSLKQSLAEKTSELEKCLVELQEKSNVADSAELCRGELAKCENLAATLQETLSQRNAVLESCEEFLSHTSVPEELQSLDITDKLKWLVNQVASLQETVLQNNAVFQTSNEIFSQISISEDIESMDMIERLKGLVNLVTSLQEMISQRNKILISLEDMISEVNAPVELQSMDAVQRFKWIMEERDALKSNLLEFHRLKDALSLIDIPETTSSSDLETRIGWLKDSVKQAKDEINMLQEEIARTKEAAHKEIDSLSGALLAELQEKEYAKMELDELAQKYEEISQEAHQASLEKDQMVRLLLEGSGIEDTYSDVATLVERCFGKVKEQSTASSFDASPADAEVFERIQSLLYVRDLELMFYAKFLEEDALVQLEVNNLSNELRVASVELAALKEEKDSLRKTLEQSEERSALLKEKLSLAVKKGKGVFQDLKNLKLTLDDKNSEIEKLKLELQHQESAMSECRDQISRLSADLEQAQKLEADLVDMKNQRDQFEQFLLESNSMLQRVIESVDRIVLPPDLDFEEPIEKVNWLAGYMNECQIAKSKAEQELGNIKEETIIMAGKLAEAEESIKYLEDALSASENHISQIAEEKQEIEVAKENIEQDLKKAKEEAHAQTSNFNEACATRKSLEDALSLAENNISLFVKEKEEAQLSRAATETELEKVREEAAVQTEKLTEAYRTIKSLEAALSQAEVNGSLLSEQNNHFQVERTDLENELKKLKEEAESHASRLEDTTTTMKQLEEAKLSRAAMETELEKAREEVAGQTEKLTEAYRTIKSLEVALSQAEANITLLSEQNSLFQVGRTDLENELKKLKEEAESLACRLADTSITIKQLEDAQLGRAATETELEKVREEIAFLTEKLTEAYSTIKSLEDALSQAEANISLLSEENNHFQVGRIDLESELEKLKEKATSQASRLADTSATIKSLEDALSKAGNIISGLEGEKRIAEQEISALNSRLRAYMDELPGTNGSLENRSAELIHHLGDIQMLVRNERLLSMARQHFEEEFEKLRNMDLILRDIKGHLVNKSSEVLPSHPIMEEDLHLIKPFPHDLGNIIDTEMDDSNLNAADVDSISKLLKKTVEEFQLRNSNLVGNFDGFFTFITELIDALLVKLRVTKDAVANIFEHMEFVKQKMMNMEMDKGEQDKTIAMLEKDCRVLLSACANATSRLQFEVKNNLLDLCSIPELEKLKNSMIPEVTELDSDEMEHGSRYENMAEILLLAARKVHTLTKLFESTSNVAASTIEDLQKKLRESRAAYESTIEERDMIQKRVSKLETDVDILQNSCKELRLKTEDYQVIEEKLKETEAELLHNNLSMKEQEAEHVLMSPSELKTLYDKIRKVEIPNVESEVGDLESHNLVDVQKLFYIIDSASELHHQMNTLSHDKDKLQSTLAMQVLEIEHLKEEIETLIRNNQESEKAKTEIAEVTLVLDKIISMLGGSEIVGDQKSASAQRLLPLVEKQITALIWEAKNSKSEAQELGARLLGSQKVIDELSTKVKLLEDSFESKTVAPEIVQERRIFEAPSLPTGSEISEIEDVGPVGKNTISPVASAAQLRTMRKGSTDHLVLNVDSESASLINNEETDEDKGHVFKSLNTSGLIPKQGKSLADRIDGIWVSGGRILMSRPRARLGLIAYCLVLHLWLLGSIL